MSDRCICGAIDCIGKQITVFRVGRISAVISHICIDRSCRCRDESFGDRFTSHGTFWFMLTDPLRRLSCYSVFSECSNFAEHHFNVRRGHVDSVSFMHVTCLVSNFSGGKLIKMLYECNRGRADAASAGIASIKVY